jgi:cytochrome c oxidase subunit 2
LPSVHRAIVVFGLFLAAVNDADAAAPLQYLSGAGDKTMPIVHLTWGVIIISLVVMAVISVLLASAIWHRPGLALRPGEKTALGGEVGGLNWLWLGVGISFLALLFTVAWTMVVLARVETPGAAPAVTIEITGKQWWWQARYLSSGDVARSFVTADEIHIPVGQPVRVKLVGGDVIHSFWVPQLSGKMDAIPGQTNETWLQAARPGTYRGQCTEYCGLQHAHMGLVVVADAPADFQKWWAHQLEAPTPGNTAGQDVFVSHCGGCHTVRGTDAAGNLGPDLSHLMARTTLAAATLPNDEQNLAHWIADPQSVKPGSLMQPPQLSGGDLAAVASYLETLK